MTTEMTTEQMTEQTTMVTDEGTTGDHRQLSRELVSLAQAPIIAFSCTTTYGCEQ